LIAQAVFILELLHRHSPKHSHSTHASATAIVGNNQLLKLGTARWLHRRCLLKIRQLKNVKPLEFHRCSPTVLRDCRCWINSIFHNL